MNRAHRIIVLAMAAGITAGCQGAASTGATVTGRALHSGGLDAPISLQGCWGAPGAGGHQIIRVPCPEDLTPTLLASLQRALMARGYLTGPVNGALDAPTRAAVLAFQAARGINSPDLTLRAAQELGLMPWDPDDL